MDELETLERFEAGVAAADEVATSVARERLRGAIAAEVANRRRNRRRRHGAAFAVGAVAAAALAVTLAVPSGPATPTHSTGKHSAVLELASFHFSLPSGFVPRDAGCASPPSVSLSQDGNQAVHKVGANPETVLQTMRSAASADGGCVEVALAAGSDVVPAGATEIAVGNYEGYLSTASNGDLTLVVAIPVAYGTNYLVLASEGLTQQQLVAIATSGLPTSGGNQPMFERH
jgi:hypothetical protein